MLSSGATVVAVQFWQYSCDSTAVPWRYRCGSTVVAVQLRQYMSWLFVSSENAGCRSYGCDNQLDGEPLEAGANPVGLVHKGDMQLCVCSDCAGLFGCGRVMHVQADGGGGGADCTGFTCACLQRMVLRCAVFGMQCCRAPRTAG
jgi:hypothetical protein